MNGNEEEGRQGTAGQGAAALRSEA
jgi:hypothetical protein